MDLKNVASHFRFGQNWSSYEKIVDEEMIAEAVRGLEKLVPADAMKGKEFLDIGCGSGLSMLAALRMGAGSVKGIDIDPDSVQAARNLLSRFASQDRWSVQQYSVFDLNPETFGRFDIVYSWGVLHHTGAMWEAVAKAGALVKEQGLFLLALYHKTPCCGFWRVEKKYYAHASRPIQFLMRIIYKIAFFSAMARKGQNPFHYVSGYKSSRGMDWHHDVHDWLGGYPYESVLPDEVVARLGGMGFFLDRVFDNCAGGRGFLGTGCDEFVARRGRA